MYIACKSGKFYRLYMVLNGKLDTIISQFCFTYFVLTFVIFTVTVLLKLFIL